MKLLDGIRKYKKSLLIFLALIILILFLVRQFVGPFLSYFDVLLLFGGIGSMLALSWGSIRMKDEKWELPVRVGVGLLCLALLIYLLIPSLVPGFLFHPGEYEVRRDVMEDSGFEYLELTAPSGNKVSGYLHPAKGDPKKAPVLLFFYGNGMKATDMKRLMSHPAWEQLASEYNLLSFDYPSYGNSEGLPTTENFREMTEVAANYALKYAGGDPKRVTLLGFSIGTAAASHAATMEDWKGLVVVSPISTVRDVVNAQIPVIDNFNERLLAINLKPAEETNGIQCPIHVFYSKDDTIVYGEVSEKYLDSFEKRPQVTIVEGYNHNDFLKVDELMQKITKSIQEI